MIDMNSLLLILKILNIDNNDSNTNNTKKMVTITFINTKIKD